MPAKHKPAPSQLALDPVDLLRAELREQLSRAPIVTIRGVVDPNGAYSMQRTGAKETECCCALSAWRINGGPLNRGLLGLTRYVRTQAQERRWEKDFPESTQVEFTARLARRNPTGTPQAEVLAFISHPRDRELKNVLKELEPDPWVSPKPKPTNRTEAQRRKNRALRKQLQSSPRVDLAGVIQPGYSFETKLPGERFHTFEFNLVAWRVNGGPLERGTLRVTRPLPRKPDPKRTKHLRGFASFSARLARKSILGTPQALMLDPGGVCSMTDLKAVARELRKPRTLRDPVLGPLRFDPVYTQWCGHLQWAGKRITLEVSGQNGSEESAFAFARRMVKAQSTWSRRCHRFTVKHFYANYNRVWNVGSPPLSQRQFFAKVKPTGLSVIGDGSFVLDMDSTLHGGHGLRLFGNIHEGLKDHDMIG